ncbi:MAG: hypothetical protein DMG56_18050, partial [Acidobacteria bacterium]
PFSSKSFGICHGEFPQKSRGSVLWNYFTVNLSCVDGNWSGCPEEDIAFIVTAIVEYRTA